MKIEALLFDLGKVLIDFDFDLGLRRLMTRTGLPQDEFERILRNEDWIGRYERGQISTADFHRYLCNAGELSMELEEFLESWSAVFLPVPIVSRELLLHLKSRYPLILVSNTNEAHVRFISRNYDVLSHFSRTIFSHEVGSMKPDRRIYEAAIEASGKPPGALFFTDDREENVDAARDLGIYAHQFVSEIDLVGALTAHGVTVGG